MIARWVDQIRSNHFELAIVLAVLISNGEGGSKVNIDLDQLVCPHRQRSLGHDLSEVRKPPDFVDEPIERALE